MKKVISIIAIALVVLILGSGMSIWATRCKILDYQEDINATYTANQVAFDTKWKKFKELAQVSKLQEQQFKDVYTDLITGRNQDKNLLMKMVQEDNPQLDTSVYTKIQEAIITDESDFKNDQKDIVSKVATYNQYINRHPVVVSLITAKKMDPNKFVVTSNTTQNAFETGKSDEVNILE